MRFEQFSNVAQACIAGLGIALMPTFLIESELETRQLVKAYDHTVRSTSSYYLVRPLAKVSYPPVMAFSNWLLEQVREFERQRSQ
jgi:DNA-binding transcriptional LysR family regulator